MHKMLFGGLLLFVLGGVALIVSARGEAATVQVSASDSFVFSPADITIEVGDTVQWTWATSFEHNVIADDNSFTSGAVTTSEDFSQTFNTAGTFDYYCELHGAPGGISMSGTITVQAVATATPTNTTAAGSATASPTRTPTRTPSPTGTLSPTTTATATPAAQSESFIPISAPDTSPPPTSGSAPAVQLPNTGDGAAGRSGAESGGLATALLGAGLICMFAAAGAQRRRGVC